MLFLTLIITTGLSFGISGFAHMPFGLPNVGGDGLFERGWVKVWPCDLPIPTGKNRKVHSRSPPIWQDLCLLDGGYLSHVFSNDSSQDVIESGFLDSSQWVVSAQVYLVQPKIFSRMVRATMCNSSKKWCWGCSSLCRNLARSVVRHFLKQLGLERLVLVETCWKRNHHRN